MQILVTDRDTVQRESLECSSYVVISISDHGASRPRVAKGAGLRSVLYLDFDDTGHPARGGLAPGKVPMTPAQASLVWRFVAKHRGAIEAILVHCNQGLCRSPAIAAAIAGSLGQDNRAFWVEHRPNQYVYELMIAECPEGWGATPAPHHLSEGRLKSDRQDLEDNHGHAARGRGHSR